MNGRWEAELMTQYMNSINNLRLTGQCLSKTCLRKWDNDAIMALHPYPSTSGCGYVLTSAVCLRLVREWHRYEEMVL